MGICPFVYKDFVISLVKHVRVLNKSRIHDFSRVDKQRNEPGRWKSRIVAIFLLFLTLLHVLT